MKGKIIGIIAVFLLILWVIPGILFIGAHIIDFVAHSKPYSDEEVRQMVQDHLEKRYGEPFVVVEEVRYSRPLGEDSGRYTFEVNAVKQPGIWLHVYTDDNVTEFTDDYMEMKWRDQLKQQMKPLMDRLYPQRYGYFFNIGMPPELHKRYDMEESYEKIISETRRTVSFCLSLHSKHGSGTA